MKGNGVHWGMTKGIRDYGKDIKWLDLHWEACCGIDKHVKHWKMFFFFFFKALDNEKKFQRMLVMQGTPRSTIRVLGVH